MKIPLFDKHLHYNVDGFSNFQEQNSNIITTENNFLDKYFLLENHNISHNDGIHTASENKGKLGYNYYSRNGFNTGISPNHLMEFSPLLPFGILFVISIIICVLILFRRWPGIVAATIAGCLTSLTIYLMLVTIKDQTLVYE